MNLNLVSDDQIRTEYQRRFTLPVGTQMHSSKEAIDHLRQFIQDSARESFLVVFLNGNNRLVNTEVLFQGSLTSSFVASREVIRKVLNNQSASIILCHNHPSGNLNPSREDIEITKKIKEATSTIDVSVLDHIIITSTDYYSFADHGLL